VFTLYNISLWLHITAAVVGLGATFALSIGYPLALKLDPHYMPFVHHLSMNINRKLASPALLILIATGIYQALDSDTMDEPWVGGTFLIALILGGLQGSYFAPTDKKLARMAEEELAGGATKLSDGYLARVQKEGTIGAVSGLLIVLAVFLMTVKPGS
jgi:hypothetical protein